MIIILLLFSIIAYVVVMTSMGALSKRLFTNTADQMYFQFIRNALCFVLLAAIFRALSPSMFTLMLSVAMGVALLVSSVFSIVAYQRGPVSISVLIISSLAMVISALCGPIFWGEPISVLQIIGILLSITSMVLLTEKTLVEKASFVWIMAVVLCGLGGGAQGLVQKVLMMSPHAAESNEFVTYSVLFLMIASLIMLIFIKKKKNEQISYKMNWKIFAVFLLQALLYVFLNINNLKLISELPTIIFFPAYSIGGLLLTSIASIIIFKEKLSGRQIAGFIIGIAALLLISGTLESIG